MEKWRKIGTYEKYGGEDGGWWPAKGRRRRLTNGKVRRRCLWWLVVGAATKESERVRTVRVGTKMRRGFGCSDISVLGLFCNFTKLREQIWN